LRSFDVAARAPGDDADVRGRLLVDAAEPEIRDRLRCSLDRGAAFLREHSGVRRTTVEAHLHRLRPRRAKDDLADRRGLVVDVAELRVQPLVIERVRAFQPDFFLRREEQLDAGVRAVFREHAPHSFEHRDDRRLVVGAEDRAAGVPDNAVVDDRLHRPGGRHRVEVRAEEERRPVGSRLEPRVDVAHRRADRGPAVVLVRLEPDFAQVTQDYVGDCALLARRARDRGKLKKKRQDRALSFHVLILGSRP